VRTASALIETDAPLLSVKRAKFERRKTAGQNKSEKRLDWNTAAAARRRGSGAEREL